MRITFIPTSPTGTARPTTRATQRRLLALDAARDRALQLAPHTRGF